MSEQKEQKKSEEEILFPEAKVNDLTIRPWSFWKLFELSPFLDNVLDKMEEKNIDLDKFGGVVPYTVIARLFTIASPQVKKIILLTLEKSEEELKDLSMEDGIKIATIIYLQNKETIKNALSSLWNPKRGKRELQGDLHP